MKISVHEIELLNNHFTPEGSCIGMNVGIAQRLMFDNESPTDCNQIKEKHVGSEQNEMMRQ